MRLFLLTQASPNTPETCDQAPPPERTSELKFIVILVLVIDFLNTLVREIIDLVKENIKTKDEKVWEARLEELAKWNISIFIALAVLFLLIASIVTLKMWCRSKEFHSPSQNNIQLLCIAFQIIAAFFYFFGDNSEDIIEHAENWKCDDKCQKALRYTAAIVLGFSLALFRPIIPFIQENLETILKTLKCSKESNPQSVFKSESGRNTGYASGVLLLLSLPKIDLVYTLIGLISDAGKKDCGFGIHFLFGITLLIGIIGIVVSPVWQKEICLRDKISTYVFGGLLVPILIMYVLADNAKPLDCWMHCNDEKSAKCDPAFNSGLRIAFVIICGILLIIYFVIFCIYSHYKNCSCKVCKANDAAARGRDENASINEDPPEKENHHSQTQPLIKKNIRQHTPTPIYN